MSKLFKLKLNDFWRGFVLCIFTATLTIVYNTVQAGSLNFDWKYILTTTLLAGLAYLLKNIASNSKNEPFKPEPPKLP
jgi:hypothetical protein